MPPELLDALRRRIEELFAEEGALAGGEFKQEPEARRLANLVDKGPDLRRRDPHSAACSNAWRTSWGRASS